MSVGIAHVFYDIHMMWSHGSLREIFRVHTDEEEVPKGQCALFINKDWTACKILAPGGLLLYYRSPYRVPITKEQIKVLPSCFGGKVGFQKNWEANVMKVFASKFGRGKLAAAAGDR